MRKEKARFKGWIWDVLLLLITCVIATGFSDNLHAQAINAADANGYTVLLDRNLMSNNDIVKENNLITVNFTDIRLTDALHKIAREFNVGLAFNAGLILNNNITIQLQKVTVYEALDSILAGTGLEAKIPESRDVIFIKQKETLEIRLETVTGTVTDATNGETLPGVNVLVKGTSMGTATDVNGKYELTVESLQDTLVFSFIGYQRQEVAINGRAQINVALQMQTIAGEELVVVGYGTQRRENLTGSVTTVSSGDFENIATPNTSTLLQGKMPGVTVSNFAPQPGKDDAQIRIRGVGTFNSGQNPLVVIDGVSSSISAFSRIPPSDIENVTVLKDAASAAIYGARAANGVILVQTKKGVESVPKVTFRSTITRQTPLIKPDLLDSWEYAQIVNEWRNEQGSDEVYTDEMIQKMKDGSDPDHFANTNWFDELIKPSTMQNYYLSVAGGTETAQYMVSTEYNNQPGIMIGTSSDQFSVRSNLNIDVSDKFQLGLRLSGSKQVVNEPATASASSNSGTGTLPYELRRKAPPTIPVKYSNGEWGTVDGVYPSFSIPSENLVQMAQLGEQYTEGYYLNGQLYGNIEVLDNLNFKSSAAIIYTSALWSSFEPSFKGYDSEGNVMFNNPSNSLGNSNDTSYKLSNTNTITYKQQFQNHNLTVLGGQSVEYFRHDYMYAYAEGFPSNNIHELTAGVENKEVDGWAQDNGLFSLFGRIGYNYDGKYLLEANLRYDGSSRLPEDSRFGLFPSFSTGWKISDENFMQGIESVSFLKLRASWGKLGNQEIGNYPYVQTLSAGQDYLIGGKLQGGAAITDIANSNIVWETTTIADIGLDVNLFEDKLQMTVDYFDKATSDILLRLPIPATQGDVEAPYQNVGSVSNRGWEFTVNYNHFFNNGLGINAGFNVSQVKNEITDLGKMGDNELGGWVDGNSINVIGRPIGAYYGYVAEGYFQSEDEIQKHAQQFGDLAPGDIKFKDLNDDGVIDPDNDRRILGNPFPNFSFGINLGAQFKGFDLVAFIQGLSGINRWNWYNNEYNSEANFTKSVKDHWSEDNREAQFPRLGNTTNNNEYSSFWLIDASYLRLKHLGIGYNLPVSITQKLSFDDIRIYFAGYNMFTITKMKDFDPERATGDNRNAGYPQMKNYALGISLKF